MGIINYIASFIITFGLTRAMFFYDTPDDNVFYKIQGIISKVLLEVRRIPLIGEKIEYFFDYILLRCPDCFSIHVSAWTSFLFYIYYNGLEVNHLPMLPVFYFMGLGIGTAITYLLNFMYYGRSE